MVHKDKTLPRIQNHIPESKKISQNPKHIPESGLWKVFSNSGSVFDSGKCFWILGSVLEFREAFLDSGKCFGIWEVFCPSEPPYNAIA